MEGERVGECYCLIDKVVTIPYKKINFTRFFSKVDFFKLVSAHYRDFFDLALIQYPVINYSP